MLLIKWWTVGKNGARHPGCAAVSLAASAISSMQPSTPKGRLGHAGRRAAGRVCSRESLNTAFSTARRQSCASERRALCLNLGFVPAKASVVPARPGHSGLSGGSRLRRMCEPLSAIVSNCPDACQCCAALSYLSRPGEFRSFSQFSPRLFRRNHAGIQDCFDGGER